MQTIAEADDGAVDALGDAVVALVRAYRHAGRRGVHGVDPAHPSAPLLELVAQVGTGEHRLGELAERRGVGQSAVSRQVDELEARGLALRRPDPADGRACLVRLTPDGLHALAELDAVRRGWLRGALADRPPDDVRAVTRIVAALAAQLERDGTRQHPTSAGPHPAATPRTPGRHHP